MNRKEYQEAMVQQHRDWTQKHGLNEKALGWGSEEGMLARYNAACQVLDLISPPGLVQKTVLDVGCGYGGLLRVAELRFPKRYVGIDLVEEFIHEAAGRRKVERDAGRTWIAGIDFLVADVFAMEEKFDIVFALGVAWMEGGKEFLRALMQKCFDLCEVATVVSVTHDMTLGEKEGFNLLSTDEFARMAGEVAERWVVRHDFWPNDLMCYLYKSGWERW